MQLSATQVVTWSQPNAPAGITPQKVYIGPVLAGLPGFQVAIASASSAPSRPALRDLFVARKGHTQTQLVVAVTYGPATHLFGPDPQSQPIELPTELAQRQLQSVLAEPDALSASDRWAGFRKAHDSSGGLGFSNSGLFATHHIIQNVPHRPDWVTLNQTGSGMLSVRGRTLIGALGFKLLPASSGTFLLATSANDPRAVAVLLEDSENFEGKSPRFQLSPVAFGLAVAAQERVPWLVVLRKDQIRLYPGRDGVGVGSKGQSETFFEVDLATVDAGHAGLLPLVFSADALAADGSADQLLRDSARYATELGARLRERIYEHVVPTIAVEVAQQLASTGLGLDSNGLSTAYRVTLRILFRLLFQAYAEDRGLLPSGRNEGFDANSLKTNAGRLLVSDGVEFGEASTIWRDLEQVWNAVDQGNPQWQIPAYNGGLFSTDAERSPDGALIDEVKVPDKILGPALRHLLIDRNSDGDEGPVDFRSLSVREFGTIYEGLLESSLSLAEQDLTADMNGAWVPARPGDDVLAPAGAVYFHSASGERKATGSYFTPKVIVDHLIERSVVPALTAHLDQIATYLTEGDAVAASREFFDFRVADLAMGSGHFLVAAVDKIEALMRSFLTEHSVPGVTDELLRLAQVAKDALGTDDVAKSEVDEVGLLRRQIARRCIYGLDINPMSVELARLALWIHTFVPGLPMSNLDHGLVCANSLTGVGTIDEAIDALVGQSTTRPAEPSVLSDGGLLGVDLVVSAPRETGYQKMVRDAVTTYLKSALPLLADVAKASEANKAEIDQSSELLAEARAKAHPARRILDAAIAKRAGRLDDSHQISRPESIKHLAESDEPSRAIASLAPAQLPALFPEVFLRPDPGFDVVLGNPPWDKVRHEPTAFWAVRDPGLNALPDQQRNARIEHLRANRPVEAAEERAEEADRRELQEYFKSAFPWRGGTHLELAQLFLERALRTVRSTGEVALVLPRQFTVLAGWKNLRTELFTRRDALLVQARNKGEWLFEGVHASYAVVMLNASPLRLGPVQVGVVGSAQDLRALAPQALLKFTRDELSAMSETMAVPWFNNPGDRTIFDKMRAFPRISKPGSWVRGTHDARWDFRGTGPDKGLVVRSDAPGAWKVMMTRHADAYGLRETTVKQFIVDFDALAAKGRGIDMDQGDHPRIAEDHPVVIFRHPSRSDDTRTLIATALPASGWIYNKGYVHAFAHATGTGEDEKLAVLGLLNSVIEDWWARRFVDRHVTAPVINNLPIPALDKQSIKAIADQVAVLLDRARVSKLAGDIDVQDRAHGTPYRGSSTVELLAGIDALIARGYGLAPVDLASLREDFTSDGYPEAVFTLTCDYLIR